MSDMAYRVGEGYDIQNNDGNGNILVKFKIN